MSRPASLTGAETAVAGGSSVFRGGGAGNSVVLRALRALRGGGSFNEPGSLILSVVTAVQRTVPTSRVP